MESTKNEVQNVWGIADVWNASLLDQEKRVMEPRERLWASELGGAPIDIYLKMKGTAQTNPPNPRALRKFEAGNVYEWIVSLVLKRAGILIEGQTRCEHQYQGMLNVSGKVDFIAGGKADMEKVKEFLEFLHQTEMPEVFIRGFYAITSYLNNKYPDGLEEMPLEVKSVSTYAMDVLEVSRAPMKRHRLQLFHYLKSMDYRKGMIVYICRDDMRMMEFPVLNPSNVEDEYKAAIEGVSKYWFAGEQPPKEKMLIFDEDAKKFSKNLNVEWSGYLTMLYNFQEPREYSDIYAKKAIQWNSLLSRVKKGAKMTPKNEEWRVEIEEAGYNVAELVEKLPDAPIIEEDDASRD